MKVEVFWVEDIGEWREVFICACCGKNAYYLGPGDVLPTHLDPNDVTELVEE